MPLRHERPSREYMRELKAVARSAGALRDHLPKVNLLPDGFPLDQVEGFCKALVRLPNGTAEGSIAPLRAADSELNRIRQRFIPAHDEDAGDAEPLVPRDSDFDLRLVGLMAAARAAIERYKFESGDDLDTDVTPDLPAKETAKNAIAAALEATGEASGEVDDVSACMESIDNQDIQESFDVEAMLASDAGVQVESTAASLKTESPRVTVINWLADSLGKTKRTLENNLYKHSESLEKVAKELGETARELIEINFPKLVKSLAIVQKRLRNVVAILSGDDPDGPPADFSYIKVYDLLLSGGSVPDSWAPFISELSFNFFRFHHLDDAAQKKIGGSAEDFDNAYPLQNLSNLRTLDLASTRIRDLSPLAGLTNLETLYLTKTQVTDIMPLAELANLRSLNLVSTQVTDLSPIANLTSMRHLYLFNTQVTDLSPLANLKDLKVYGP